MSPTGSFVAFFALVLQLVQSFKTDGTLVALHHWLLDTLSSSF